MIDTVIFDIGNVLMKFDFFPLMERLFSDQKVIDAIAETFFKTGYWNGLDLGIYNGEQFLQKAIAHAPKYKEEFRYCFENLEGCLLKEDFAAPWIQSLKDRGYRVLFLSNYSEPIMKIGPEALYFLPLMDGGVFSCDVHICKPDPEIYHVLKEKYDLDFSTCVFLDDTMPNLEEASRQGLHTIHVQSHQQAADDLEMLLKEKGLKN